MALADMLAEVDEIKKSAWWVNYPRSLEVCVSDAIKGSLTGSDAIEYVQYRQGRFKKSDAWAIEREIAFQLEMAAQEQEAEPLDVFVEADLDIPENAHQAELKVLREEWIESKSDLKQEVCTFLQPVVGCAGLRKATASFVKFALTGDVAELIGFPVQPDALLSLARRYNEIESAISAIDYRIKNAREFESAYGRASDQW
jgi:hypothetical protein